MYKKAGKSPFEVGFPAAVLPSECLRGFGTMTRGTKILDGQYGRLPSYKYLYVPYLHALSVEATGCSQRS